MAYYDFEKQISITDKDVSEYLKKRYKDYYRDLNEYSEDGENWYKNPDRAKHLRKRDQLVILGFELKKKLGFFLEESRKELFEQAFSDLKLTDSYFKDKYDDFCKELGETNNLLSLQNRKTSHQLDTEKLEKEKQLFERKELRKNEWFVYKIDERRDKYVRDKLEYERTKPEREKRKAIEKLEKERDERRNGLSNIKTLSFYEELFNSGDVEYDNERIKEEQEYDTYFQENGKPKGVWKTYRTKTYAEKRYWSGDRSFSDEEVDKYILSDNPSENQKRLNNCKEIRDVIVDLDESQREYLHDVDILQKYLTKKYLITRQIAWFVFYLKFTLIEELSTDPNDQNKTLRNHPSKEYDFDIYNDDFDIINIKEDVSEFIRISEGMVLTPIEYLKVYLKKHDNRITAKEYSLIINKSYKVALRILKEFVANKELMSKKGDRGLLIFYSK